MSKQMRKPREWTKKCMAIWKTIQQHKHGWVFHEPVDPVKLNLPDYFEVIKHPMDLSTIKNKMDQGIYQHPDDYESDMLLMFNNAKTFNPVGTDVYLMAQTLEDLFKKKYSEAQNQIMQKFEEEQNMPAVNEIQSRPSGGASASAAASGSKDKNRTSTKKLLDMINFGDNRPMSFEEKKQLSNDMNQLSSKKLGKIVEIIHFKHPKLLKQNENDPDEIEIDIDQIEAGTLRGIQEFVSKSLQSSRKKRQRE